MNIQQLGFDIETSINVKYNMHGKEHHHSNGERGIIIHREIFLSPEKEQAAKDSQRDGYHLVQRIGNQPANYHHTTRTCNAEKHRPW